MVQYHFGKFLWLRFGSEVSDGLAYRDTFGGARRVVGVLTDIQLFVCWLDVCPNIECVSVIRGIVVFYFIRDYV